MGRGRGGRGRRDVVLVQGRMGSRTTGSEAVAAGVFEVILCGAIAGFAGYGLVSMYLKWMST